MPRVLLDRDPLLEPTRYRFMDAPWPVSWIGPVQFDADGAGVWAFRCKFNHSGETLRVHVSADQRYHLYLDGRRVGRGPERGDLRHWMYNSYDLDVTAGAHTLVAIVWWCSPTSPTPPPWAQQTQRPGFLLMAEGDKAPEISTGHGHWDFRAVTGVGFDPVPSINWFADAIGWRVKVDGQAYPWGIERGECDGWQPARVLHAAAVASVVWESHPYWLLRPALLPEMREARFAGARVRHIEEVPDADTILVPVNAQHHIAAEEAGWTELLRDHRALELPPHTRRRVVVDFQTYLCGYTGLTTSGGAGATVRVRWAESLFIHDASKQKTPAQATQKGNRSEITGRHFTGFCDTFTTDGGAARAFESLWWKSGRYVEIYVETHSEPLTIDALAFTETAYPYDFTAKFNSSDPRLENVIPIALHTLKMCSHETSTDCPYYEQLNYTGDTRLQSLVAMTCSRDDRLVRKSILLFDWSRTGDTWTSGRYPTRSVQTIPTFAMWWVAMVYDYAMYRGDLLFLRQVMPGVRAVIERWRQQIDETGLLKLPAGWNFVDWVKGWQAGMSNPVPDVGCGITQWQFVYTLMLAAELEGIVNEPLLAQRHVQTAAALAATAERTFCVPERGLFADDPAHIRFSEHAQVLALISGQLSTSIAAAVANGLLTDGGLARTSIYFSHYTFEALAKIGRIDVLINRMNLWFEHERMGLFTLLEEPEPSRSDCHAWGAHPVFHYFASILGIRPAAPAFTKVMITPKLGPLEWAAGEMIHPLGSIRTKFERHGESVSGEIELPPGVTGELVLPDQRVALTPGLSRF
ncbi:MAG: alpha-L-rhamnosidase [Burkholderiales bacterium]|nr:alpha-L-rhamnosidase [Phycisphaerae bacterium]